jgi:hypothetical protein
MGEKMTPVRVNFRLDAKAIRRINRVREWEERSAKVNFKLGPQVSPPIRETKQND